MPSAAFPPPWLASVNFMIGGNTFGVERDALSSLCVLCAFMTDTGNGFSVDLDCLGCDVAKH
jgi:hypothetical protein